MRLFYKEKLGNGCRAIYFMGWRICYYKRNPDRHCRFVNCDISPLALIDSTSTVGNFAVIGASAFVNRDVPDFGIAVGVPARVVRLRFTPEQREKIVRSKYWLLPPEEARAVIRELGI